MAPVFFRPENKAPLKLEYINEVSQNGNSTSMNKWWEKIKDDNIKADVNSLINGNLDLRQATERIIQAEENLRMKIGDYYPTLGLDGRASRSFTPSSGFNSGISSLITNNRIYDSNVSTDLNSSWQLDLFGKIKNSAESAEASYESSIYDREALLHSLVSQLVNKRVAISVNKELLELSKQSVENERKLYQIVKNRYESGVSGTTASDVLLAQENYLSKKSDINQYERALYAEMYSFDVLLGNLPGASSGKLAKFPLLPEPFALPLCLPLDLLDRRPDLKSSELLVKSANADIGVAVADLYPDLSLSGSIGYNGNDFANLISADQLAGSILANITTKLFQGGKLRANIRIQESRVRQLSAAYAKDVLNAIREVETLLKNEREFEQEIENSKNALQASNLAEEISQQRFIAGLLTLQQYLDIQQRNYQMKKSNLILKQQRWENRVALYLALGGDWFKDEEGKSNNTQCSNEVIYE